MRTKLTFRYLMGRHKESIRILPCRQEPYRFYLDGIYINGKRQRRFFKTRAEAMREFNRLRQLQFEQGQAGLSLSETIRGLAVDCMSLLAPYPGQTILDATRFYVAHLENLNRSVSLGWLVTEYLKSKRQARLSEVHLNDIEYRLRRFGQAFDADRAIRTITSVELGDWLHALSLSPTSVNNFRTALYGLFNYAVDHGLLDKNPVDAIQKVKAVNGKPAIFAPEALSKLLGASPDDLKPLLAIGAFAGLRTAELLQLEWSEVDLERGLVEVKAEKAKSAKRRLVKIEPALRSWLEKIPHRAGGRVYPEKREFYHKKVRELCARTGVAWQDNGLRHSYASYHLAKFKDAPALALEMGHSNVRMLFDHYRELVTPEAAQAYWSIHPQGEPAK